MISSYIFSFKRPVTLAWVERCAQESFASANPDELVVYPDMGDIGFGPLDGARAQRVAQKVSLAELRLLARKRKHGAQRININRVLAQSVH